MRIQWIQTQLHSILIFTSKKPNFDWESVSLASYKALKQENIDQAISLIGERNSGKSFISLKLVEHFIVLAGEHLLSKRSKIQMKLQAAFDVKY
jgi:hypothetical protein